MLAVLALALLCSTPTSAQCVVGTNAALSFDGVNDRVRLGNPPALNFAGIITIEAWILPLSTSGIRNIVAHGWTLTPPGQVVLSIEGLCGQAASAPQYCVYSWPFPACAGVFVPFNPIDVGTWVHLAGVYDGTKWNLYRNAQLLGTYVTTAGAISINEDWAIGSRGTGTERFFHGSIDEVRIWNVARTQTQIQSTMNVGLTGSEAGLVGYWRFDEGSGQTVFNSAVGTGSALDGTLGTNALPGTDDPTWISTGLPPLPYCPPCPSPPCGQVNSPCATLTVNGVGAGAQGPFNVAAPAGSILSLNWTGAPNQPYVLVATPNLIPGQVVAPPSFVVDVNIGSFAVVLSGFDPFIGPLFFTTPTGIGAQTFIVPSVLVGSVLNVQGLIYDLSNTCSGGVGLATTASFLIQF